MRRRRSQLQVSTFPFLAVLLCAMGSLILLLLVIDRRAKVVMRAKALAAVRQIEQEEEQQAAARAAEWERRRQTLHEQLQQQQQEVETQATSIQKQLAAAAGDLQAEQAQNPLLERQLQDAREKLAGAEQSLASQVRETNQEKDQSEANRANLAQLTADLLKMEQAVADLKALREKQRQTYSLVPYRGHRGDNRRPIYLECTDGTLILHPDRLALPVAESSYPTILGEVEKRIEKQRVTRGANAGSSESPYLLMLVRPSGIMTYYRALMALKSLHVDFGYELIEPDWILDFPDDENAAARQSWMAGGPGPAQTHSENTTRGLIRPGGREGEGMFAARADPATQGGGHGQTGPPSPTATGIGPGGMPMGSANSTASRGPLGMPTGSPFPPRRPMGADTFGTGPGFSGIGSGTAQPGSGGGQASGFSGTVATGPIGTNSTTGSFRNSQPGTEIAQPPGSSGSSPPSTGTGRGPDGSSRPSGTDAFVESVPNPSLGSNSPSTNLANREGAPSFESNRPGSEIIGAPRKAAEGSSSATANPVASIAGMPGASQPANAPGNDSPPSMIPRFESSQSGGANLQKGQAVAAERQSPPNEDDSGPQLPGSSGLSQLGAPREKRPATPPVIRRYVRRDWNIFIECKANQIIIYPGGTQIPAASLANAAISQEQPLLKAIQQMMDKRRAQLASAGTTTKDDPALSPHIRFLVRPDGLRTYFFAYPELGPLQLPMTRENLDPDEDVIQHMLRR
jgi:hypothetical protein